MSRVMSKSQTNALAFFEQSARGTQAAASATMAELCANAGLAANLIAKLIAQVNQHARITLNFHPDRVRHDGLTVIEGLLRDGVYQNQFETRVTNGSASAFPGGDRDRWEAKLFGDAYRAAVNYERPKYGALNIMGHADGASPRFGSCYLQLYPGRNQLCSFTWGDSHLGPTHLGTATTFEPLMAQLLQATTMSTEGGYRTHAHRSAHGILGAPPMTLPALIHFLENLSKQPKRPLDRNIGRSLDDYIETQIHSTISLSELGEALVVDPSFRGTKIEEAFEKLCETHRLELHWHHGFVLRVDDVPSDFRGPLMPSLARHIAQTFSDDPHHIDASVIGAAATSIHTTPSAWSTWSETEPPWQLVKKLWHVVVAFGRAESPT